MAWEWVIPAGIGLAALWRLLGNNRRRLEAWQGAAAACGLERVEISSSTTSPISFVAQAGRVEVRVEDAGYPLARVIVRFPGPPGFSGVTIQHEKRKPWGAREIEVGDEAFDSRFFVEGPPQLVARVLDADMRRLLLEAAGRDDLEVSAGALRAMVADARLPGLLPLLVELGQRIMSEPLNTAPGLAANARYDPEPGVRLRNLAHLAREFQGEQLTEETLRAACQDPSPQVRLQAATALGAKGRDVLRKLAEDPEGTVEDAVSSLAVAALGAALPLERLQAILRRALGERQIQTARACLERLGRSGDATAVPTLARVLDFETGELAIAAAVALGLTGDEAAEPPLIQALERNDAGLGVAAANALARAGTAAAVLPLKEAAERFPRNRDLHRATRQAVAEIQARLQGASPGQLSLTGDGAGQLSLATDPSGQLSLPPEAPERPGG